MPVTPTPAASPLDPDHAITFLGGGNMAAALISGLLRKGHVPGAINVIERDAARAAQLAADYGVNASTAQPGHLSHEIVVLAVKPQHMHEALRNLRVAQDCTVVSVAAGLSVAQLAGDLPQGCTIVRCMPNSPALVGAGMTVLEVALPQLRVFENDRPIATIDVIALERIVGPHQEPGNNAEAGKHDGDGDKNPQCTGALIGSGNGRSMRSSGLRF